MNLENYSTPLRFVPLREARPFLDRKALLSPTEKTPLTLEPAKIQEIRSTMKQMVDDQKWLLDGNQRIALPPLPNQSSAPLFSMSAFVKKVEVDMEKDLVAISFENGERKSLTKEQFRELRRTGKLSLDSVHFKNQQHVWRVAPWFYSSPETVKESFLEGIGCGLDYILVYERSTENELFEGPAWSKVYRQAIKSFARKLTHSLAQLVSAPLRHNSSNKKYRQEIIDQMLHQAEFGYVRYHMLESGHEMVEQETQFKRRGDIATFYWDVLRDQCDWGQEYCASALEGIRLSEKALLQVSYANSRFLEAMDDRRDTELGYDEAKARASPLAARKESVEAESAWQARADEEWVTFLQNQPWTRDDGLRPIVARRVEAQKIEDRLRKEDLKEIDHAVEEHGERLKKKNPFFSLSKLWFNQHKERFRKSAEKKLKASFNDRAREDLLKIKGMDGPIEERRLRLKFRSEIANTLRSKLEAISLPAIYEIPIMNPKDWSIGERGEVIKIRKVKVFRDQWFWRLRRARCSFWGCAVSLMMSSYWFVSAGPWSARAWISSKPFYAWQHPSRSGEFEDDPASLTPTLMSRLNSLYEALRQIREEFEAKPDRGLVSKSIQRPVLRSYSSLKAIVGSIAIVAFMLVGTLFLVPCAIIILTASPVVALLWTLLVVVFDLVFYDTSADDSSVVWKLASGVLLNLGLFGVVQGATATLLQVGIYPLVAMLLFVWAGLWAVLRSVRDCFSWVLLRTASRVPAGDSFLARRIQGPGIASETYFRLPLDAAKGCVDLILYKFMLEAHQQVRRVELKEPFNSYTLSMHEALRPFGFQAANVATTPEAVAHRVMKSSGHETRPCPQVAPNHEAGGIWDSISASVRQAHPDVRRAIAEDKALQQQRRALEVLSRNNEEITWSQLQTTHRTLTVELKSPYDVMSYRTGLLLADLMVRSATKDEHIRTVVAVPTQAYGRFRLSKDELQELWAFTLERTDHCAMLLEEELKALAEASEFRQPLTQKAQSIVDSFWLRSGARPSKDLSRLAAHVLTMVLGGDAMLEPLEDLDKTLVIEPKFSVGDEETGM